VAPERQGWFIEESIQVSMTNARRECFPAGVALLRFDVSG